MVPKRSWAHLTAFLYLCRAELSAGLVACTDIGTTSDTL